MDKIAGLKPFIDGRRLLVEDHPGVEGCANDGRNHEQEAAIADRKVDRVPRQRPQAGMGPPGDDEERELEEADEKRDPLDPLVGAAGHNDEQRRRGQREGQAA